MSTNKETLARELYLSTAFGKHVSSLYELPRATVNPLNHEHVDLFIDCMDPTVLEAVAEWLTEIHQAINGLAAVTQDALFPPAQGERRRDSGRPTSEPLFVAAMLQGAAAGNL
jgi:hypothetical protein